MDVRVEIRNHIDGSRSRADSRLRLLDEWQFEEREFTWNDQGSIPLEILWYLSGILSLIHI